MMHVEKYLGISIGDTIECIDKKMFCYPKKGVVEKIDVDEGAPNAWFHGKFEDGQGFLLAGEEIKKV